jgi:DNA-binding transcriptional MerR regulator/methylmalonyl-CoA mutase cobalamin-binding subunit
MDEGGQTSVDNKFMMDEPRHPIQVVARRTGLTADVIRAWERRHGAVSPDRSPTSRRLYSDADVERLLLLRRATLVGRRIGDVAHLAVQDLRGLVDADEAATARAPQTGPPQVSDSPVAQRHLTACLDALRELEASRLEAALSAAAYTLPTPVLIEKVLAPLMRRVGDAWSEGSVGIGHEHLATVLVRSLLSTLRSAHSTPDSGPELLATTPIGQRHELGALMAAVIAASLGWRVAYLGPEIPAEEIAAVAEQRKARAIALSIVYPSDDPRVEDELRRLRHRLAPDTAILVGGPAVPAYERALREIGAVRAQNMSVLTAELERLN